jgi:hypothetical protein
MDPKKAIKEIIEALLAWEEADAIRARIADSKSASPQEIKAANAKLVASIRRLRTIAREVRKLMRSKPKKKSNFDWNWMKALDITTKALTTMNDAVKPQPQSRIIDVTAEVVR